MAPQQPGQSSQFFGSVPPWWGQPVFAHQQPQVSNEVPARIRVGLAFLNQQDIKTAPVVAVNNIAIEEFKGEKLNVVENTTRDACLNMLADYFRGNLGPSDWEYAYIRRDLYSNETKASKCPVCEGSGRVENENPNTNEEYPYCECHSCNGKGVLLISYSQPQTQQDKKD